MEWELAAPYEMGTGPWGMVLSATMHPIDGDAARVAELAARLGGVSERVRDQIGRLRALQAGEFWTSSAGSAAQFQEAVDDLPGQLEPVATRYQKVAEALEAFHPVLAETKADAEYWIQVAADAHSDVERAEAGVAEMAAFNEEAGRAADEANDEREGGDPPVEPAEWSGPAYNEMLAEAQERLEQAVSNTRAAVRAFAEAARACSDAVHDAGDDDLKNDSGWASSLGGALGDAFGAFGDALGDAAGWVGDRLEDAGGWVVDGWDELVELWDGAWEATKFVLIKLGQAALVTLDAATLPLVIPLGVQQVTMAYLGGERDLGHLRRHFINSRATTAGQITAFTWGGADGMTYNDDEGIWVAQGLDRVPGGRAGFASGSIMMTDETSQTFDTQAEWEGFVAHEAAHAAQAEMFGGGFTWAAAYIEGWQAAGYKYEANVFEQEADQRQREREQEVIDMAPGLGVERDD